MSSDASLVRDRDVQAIWGAELHVIGCPNCYTAHLIPPGKELPRCPACLTGALEPQPARLRPEPPEQMVPFAPSVTPHSLTQGFAQWLQGVWLRPPDLQVDRLVSRLTRVFYPTWLVDGEVVGVWRAQMGFDYEVESTRERFREERGWTSQRLTEIQVRWEPRVGRLQRTFHNLAVPALDEREQAAMTARLGPYDLRKAISYTPVAVTEAAVRLPSLLPEEAWPLAQAEFDHSAATDCRRAAGAQHIDEFILQAEYRDLNWTQLLQPFYLTYYEDDTGRLFSVWVNGQNGRIYGMRRASLRKSWRVAGGVALLAVTIFLLGVLLGVLGAEAVASPVMTIGFFLAIVAALPVLWAWQFNQRPAALGDLGGEKE